MLKSKVGTTKSTDEFQHLNKYSIVICECFSKYKKQNFLNIVQFSSEEKDILHTTKGNGIFLFLYH